MALATVSAAALAAVAGGAWFGYRQFARRKTAEAPPVSTPAVFRGSEVNLQGKIGARNVVPIAAPMDGVVDAIFAEAGQDVVEGQLLARVKSARLDSVLEAATAEAERVQTRLENLEAAIVAARLESSRADADASRAKTDFERSAKVFERQQFLMKEGATPRLIFEKAEREYAAAKQELENKTALAGQAQGELDRLNRDLDAAKRAVAEKSLALDQAKADVSAGDLVAPVDGVVIAHHGQPGEEVTPAMTDFFQIATELGSLEVVVEPEPPVLARVKPGQRALVHVAEFPEDLQGTVRELRGTQVIIDFTSPSPFIKPGMTANVRLLLG